MTRLVLAVALLLPLAAAHAQTQAPSPAQSQQALEVLKDPIRRAELITILETIAKATPAAPVTPAPPAAVLPLAPDSIGAQILVDGSRRLAGLTDDIIATIRTVTDFPLLWRFAVQLTTDPWSRTMLFETAWRLLLVFAGGLAAEWVTRRLLERPVRALAAHAASIEAARRATYDVAGLAAAEAGETEAPQASRITPLQIIRRLPTSFCRLALDLLPVLALIAVGYALLAAGLGDHSIARLVILAMLFAYAACRIATIALSALIGPGEPSLFPVREPAAAYAHFWLRRIAAVAFFGYALAEIGLLFGLYRVAHDALLKLVALVILAFLVIIVLQRRAAVASRIRAAVDDPGLAALLRNRLAGVWHLVTIFYLVALWAIWALEVPNAFATLLRNCLASVVILVAARFAGVFGLRTLARWTRMPAELAERYPGLNARIGTYDPIARALLLTAIWATAVLALLTAWGIDAFGWFATGRLGGRLLAAIGSMCITIALALAVWEAVNIAIQHHLARLTRESQLARSARLRTLLPMVRTALLIALCLFAGLMVLSEIGINIAPLLAGAGVIGIAIGFGSQKLVQDIITGLFLLLENAMQVGDVVTLGGLTGVVEALSVRTIRLRASDGSVHLIPFSAVTTVTNATRDFGYAVFDFQLGLNEDPDRIIELIRSIADDMRADAKWGEVIRDDVDIFGVDKFVTNAWVLQGRIKTTAAARWSVRREFNRRVKQRFDELAIDSPLTSFQALNREPPTVITVPEGG